MIGTISQILRWGFLPTGRPKRIFNADQTTELAAEVYADYTPNEFAIEQMTRHDPLWSIVYGGLVLEATGRLVGIIGHIGSRGASATN